MEKSGDAARQDGMVVGSEQHKALFCGLLLDTFDPYRPQVIAWPVLSPEARTRLAALPFWEVALETEESAATRMQALADATSDPLIRAALALNAFEERRHKEVLGHMIRFYGVELAGEKRALPPLPPRWAFLRTGYGECFDSFFAFGLFALARRSGFFPPELVEVFEPVVQEEARHNLFFVNWVAYQRARHAWPQRIGFAAECLAALAVQIVKRLGAAKAADGDNFTRKGGEALGLDLDVRDFLALCIAENARRLSLYDARLLRPRAMPAAARLALRFLGQGKQKKDSPRRQ
jgi:hypothetical protein